MDLGTFTLKKKFPSFPLSRTRVKLEKKCILQLSLKPHSERNRQKPTTSIT